jgi:peptidoglycan hydrolase-like amidase
MLALAVAATVRIGVFALFQPVELDLRAVAGQALILESNGEKRAVDRGEIVHLRLGDRAYGRAGAMTGFMLSVPGKIHREFLGRLEIRQEDGHLLPIVEMDRETLVGAVADSEMVSVPLEALKAQAVATRSYVTAVKPRHEGYDFCDSKHCLNIKEGRPRPGTMSAQAIEQTRGLALLHHGRILPALYSANCGGHTHTLEEAGWTVMDYPFFRVACPVQGLAAGHGVGMCQRGAMEFARRGVTFRDILAYFYPGTVLAGIGPGPALSQR